MDPSIDKFLDFMVGKFGSIDPNAFNEIVFTEPRISVHVARPDRPTDPLTLFTTGMSALPMANDSGQDDPILFAELLMQLPPEWKLDQHAIREMEYAWPILILRELAQMPHLNNRNIGGPIAMVEREGPNDFVASDAHFTGFLLMREERIPTVGSKTIDLFRVTPLYWEELQMVQEQGPVSLFQAFDRCSTPRSIDIQRANVAL